MEEFIRKQAPRGSLDCIKTEKEAMEYFLGHLLRRLGQPSVTDHEFSRLVALAEKWIELRCK